MWLVWMLPKSFGAGLFFIWNNTKFVFSLFIDNLLATHQWYNLSKSSFTWIITSFKFSPYDNKEVSSANNLTALHPTALYISLMYNKKNNGPRTDQIFGRKWRFRNFLKKLLVPFIAYLAFTLRGRVSWPLFIFMFLASRSTRLQNRNLYWIFLDEVGNDQSGGILSSFMGTACFQIIHYNSFSLPQVGICTNNFCKQNILLI